MTTLRAFTCDDLFRFNNINLDPLTETYGIPFYLQYLAHWPEYFVVAEAPGGELMGYIMGKAEGSVAREEWHGHVTALSVAPEFRRLGLAAKLMELLEEISEKKGGFFVDLFVRVSNQVAVNMYKQLGYSVYRTVLEYYSASNGEPDEDAYGVNGQQWQRIGWHFQFKREGMWKFKYVTVNSVNETEVPAASSF
ncbi:N-alpha-acetyltransferase 20 isoform X2 [Pelecanus crispus]|uniref:N-alpha-acetyltransferase 20 isoform X2 n=1 Tax=Pelecanus crispus TaxID=36300 RepID=UPI003F5CFC33